MGKIRLPFSTWSFVKWAEKSWCPGRHRGSLSRATSLPDPTQSHGRKVLCFYHGNKWIFQKRLPEILDILNRNNHRVLQALRKPTSQPSQWGLQGCAGKGWVGCYYPPPPPCRDYPSLCLKKVQPGSASQWAGLSCTSSATLTQVLNLSSPWLGQQLQFLGETNAVTLTCREQESLGPQFEICFQITEARMDRITLGFYAVRAVF